MGEQSSLRCLYLKNTEDFNCIYREEREGARRNAKEKRS